MNLVSHPPSNHLGGGTSDTGYLQEAVPESFKVKKKRECEIEDNTLHILGGREYMPQSNGNPLC